MTLSLAHLVLVTVRSVSVLQNNYPSHCWPHSLEALRHLGLSSRATWVHVGLNLSDPQRSFFLLLPKLKVPVPICNVQQKYPRPLSCCSPITLPNAFGISHQENYACFLAVRVLRTPRKHNIHPGEKQKVFSPFLHLQPSPLEWLQQPIKLWEISAKISLPPEMSEQDIKLISPI